MIRTAARCCEGKRRHDTRAKAGDHLATLARAGANYHRLEAYRCRHCDGFHVGHRPKPRTRR